MIDYELLMPAGDFEKMRYALAFGADAVYLGIPRFSLRARENGFKTLEQVVEAVEYAHAIGKRVYMTANILPHNSKVEPCIEYIARTLDLCRPDAWIMSDPGLIMLMRRKYPSEVIHISVQANTVNYASVQFWREIGARRIILSRELNVREIEYIHNASDDIELEAFVHGAICIAYSGRCLISTYLTGRDPNQGTCTNSCRWKYKVFKADSGSSEREYVPLTDEFCLVEPERPGQFFPIDEDENGSYLMNARDLCVIEHLDELHSAGINSFKVEGRSKSLYYAAMIARAYRRAIDDLKAGKNFNPDNLRDIFATSNRSLTTGFIHGNPGTAGQKYDASGSHASSHRFTGIVRGYDADTGMMEVEPRNAIHKGASYDLCSPDQDRRIVVDELLNAKGQQGDQIHGGMDICRIPINQDPGQFA
ncbi:MAG: U32 family peptidase, partial [bacterium]|nr:U32 family peptidase [bacterium]